MSDNVIRDDKEKEVTREIQTNAGEFEACIQQDGTYRLRRVHRDDNSAETKQTEETHDESYTTLDDAEKAAYAKYGGAPVR